MTDVAIGIVWATLVGVCLLAQLDFMATLAVVATATVAITKLAEK